MKRGKSNLIGGTNKTDKCIFLQLKHGLGNQIFMYAAGLTIKNKTKIPLCMTPSTENPHTTRDYRTILFKQGIPVELDDIKPRLKSASKVLDFIKNTHNSWKNTNISDNTTKDMIMPDMHYQNYSSILSVIPSIRDEFKKFFEEQYAGFKDTIPSTSAFMHVRKGDYGGLGLQSEYYERGLKELDPVDGIKDIYILSDDIPWCKEQGWKSAKTIQWFDSPDELKSLYLMSLCVAGAILSGSTFSAWGAILGADTNSSSTIIYPINWITGPSKPLEFPSRWKSI